jgi:hypothetical protein
MRLPGFLMAINHERTVCAVGSRDAAGARINSTNACYAGYYDHLLPLCYLSHTCNKYNPIKPIGYRADFVFFSPFIIINNIPSQLSLTTTTKLYSSTTTKRTAIYVTCYPV